VSFVRAQLSRYRRPFALGLLCLVATNLLTVAIPWILKDAIETLRLGGPARRVAMLAALMAGAALVLAVIRTLSRLFILGASRRIVFDVRDALFARLLTLPASFYGRTRTGDIMSRAVNDLLLVRSMFGPGVLSLINVTLLYTTGLALMTALDPALTLAAVLPYPLLLLGVFRASRTIHERSNATQAQLAEISNKAQENLSGINMVKAFAREAAETAAFADLSREYRRRSLALARSRGFIVTLMGGLGAASTLVVFWLGGRHAMDGRLTLGGLVAFTSYLALLTGPTVMMGWVLGVFQRGLGAIRRIEEIMALQSDLPGDRVRGPGPEIDGAVTLRGLSFAYPDGGGPPRPALSDIDLDVPAGATIGLVGRVGAGKTTLVQLLAAVHPVPDGTVFLDGHDVNRIPTADLRSRVVMVPQEAFLFSRTIAENIALGDPGAPRARIEAAARIAGLTEDLKDWPHGLDTRVGERGVTLSGGQRQRVALARALILEPRILILDDALSSVDTATEEAILEGLRRARRGRTTFVIAHRLSTVMHADRIAVLQDGRIVEQGPPRDLLARGGLFADLHRRQQIEKELEAL
jgi:ATP-binding cassette subfamily B protein